MWLVRVPDVSGANPDTWKSFVFLSMRWRLLMIAMALAMVTAIVVAVAMAAGVAVATAVAAVIGSCGGPRCGASRSSWVGAQVRLAPQGLWADDNPGDKSGWRGCIVAR